MDFGKLIRDADKVKAQLKELPNSSVVTLHGCKIYIPARYVEQGLAFIGNENYIFGMYAMVVGDTYYAVSNACTLLHIHPSGTSTVRCNDTDYYEFSFDPGTTVITTTNAVRDDVLPYKMYKEFVEMGKVPCYFDYVDCANMFVSVPHFCGVELGATEAIVSAIGSSICKNPKDLTQPYSFTLRNIEERRKVPFAVVPFRDVQFGATNTTAKIMGSYSDQALTSALVNPSQRNEGIEDGLRL